MWIGVLEILYTSSAIGHVFSHLYHVLEAGARDRHASLPHTAIIAYIREPNSAAAMT